MKATRKESKSGNSEKAARRHHPAKSAKAVGIHERILVLLSDSDRPVSAYGILEKLGAGTGQRVYPQSVYRALDTLIKRGLVHKLDSLNAFSACAHPHRPHDGIHLICDDCGVAEEIIDPRVTDMLNKDADSLHFERRHQAIALHGVCNSCRPR